MKKHVNSMMRVNRLKHIVLALVFCIGLVNSAMSQSACTQTLRQARSVFDEGRIHELEELLEKCIEAGFNDEERTEAYRLLILAHIYLDETDKADEAMLALLKDNHGYKTNSQADPAELINLYNTFRTDPIFFWGVRLGISTTFVNVINAYGVHSIPSSEASNSNQLGFTGGLLLEKRFGNRITLRSDFQYIINSYDDNNGFFQNNQTNANIVNSVLTEQQTSLGFGLMGQFNIFPKKEERLKKGFQKLNPYVGLGGTLRYINASSATFDVTNSEGASPDGPSEDFIALEVRKQLNPTVDLEIGFKKPIQLNYLNFGFRYSYGLLNITDRNFDNRLSTFYGWAANDINIHTATFFLGILIPQYSPKKLN